MDTERADQKWMRWRKQSSKCCWNKHPATNSPREGTHPPFQSPTHHSDELQSSTINLSSNSHALLTPKLQAKHSPRSPGAAELQQLVSYLKEGTSRVKAVAAEGETHGDVQSRALGYNSGCAVVLQASIAISRLTDPTSRMRPCSMQS
jgi:hypothetical protein